MVEAKAGLILESQEKRRQKELALKLAEENRQLASSQRARYVLIAQSVYIGTCSSKWLAGY